MPSETTTTRPGRTRSQPWRLPVAILSVACGVRLLCFSLALTTPGAFREPDSAEYHRLALQLLHRGRFRQGNQPEIFRPPGYPLFAAVVYAVSGPRPGAVVLVQLAADAGVCLLLLFGTCRLTGRADDDARQEGTAAAAWHAVALVSVVFACKLLSDSLFALLLLLLLLMLRAPRAAAGPAPAVRAAGHGFAAGLLGGIMILWRAIAGPYIALTVALTLLQRRWMRALGLVAGCLLVITPWMVRNAVAAGYPGLSTVGAINLYRYNTAALRAHVRGTSFASEQNRIDRELAAADSPAARARLARRQAVPELLRHPLAYAWIHLRSSAASLLPAAGDLMRLAGIRVGGRGTLGVLQDHGPAAAVRHYFGGRPAAAAASVPAVLLLALKYLAALWGTWTLWRSGRRWECAWLVLAVGYFLLVPGPASHPRFRVPVEPVLALLAGVGAAALARPKREIGSSRQLFGSSR